MSRLISKDAFKRELYQNGCIDKFGLVSTSINQLNIALERSTVDAEPVKHGHWIFNPKDAIEMMFTLPKCSECGAESSDGGNYCPNCGAKMDEVEDETS